MQEPIYRHLLCSLRFFRRQQPLEEPRVWKQEEQHQRQRLPHARDEGRIFLLLVEGLLI